MLPSVFLGLRIGRVEIKYINKKVYYLSHVI